jgi:putative aldouronate transport system substrate-binding protein
MKKTLLVLLISVSLVCSLFAAGTKESAPAAQGPLKISMFYSDNATLPFKDTWLTVQESQKLANAQVSYEVIPIADYQTKVSLALNTGTNAPDVILYQSITGENASLALNGAIVPISDYADWTPNFNARVKEFGLENTVKALSLSDGKRYNLPSLFDVPFYDGGIIIREDLLKKYGLATPKTFDDLYNVLTVFKKNNPDSYPLTILAGPRVLYRFTMPSFGISLGRNASSGSYVLSWDYDKKQYFAGAISDQYKAYITYFHKLYAEGLLDPEMADPIDGTKWSQKMATGASMATWAYYDQIGGVTAATKIPGFKLNMYPALAGPAGAHNQPKSKTGAGIVFPAQTAKRADFEQVVRTVDKMFFSDESAKLWCLGVEGQTYTMDNGKIKFADKYVNDPRGIYKSLQMECGCGSDVTQMIWVNKREMSKYDENYAAINAEVEAMGNVIQELPPKPKFNDMDAETAGSYQTPLADAWERWNDAFLTGAKSIDKDWNAYVAEMQKLGIDKMLKLYNDNL